MKLAHILIAEKVQFREHATMHWEKLKGTGTEIRAKASNIPLLNLKNLNLKNFENLNYSQKDDNIMFSELLLDNFLFCTNEFHSHLKSECLLV